MGLAHDVMNVSRGNWVGGTHDEVQNINNLKVRSQQGEGSGDWGFQ
jgi:hypothetical protein